MVTTADQREINNFAALSDHWWDTRGPMAPLHAFTPIRIDYILANIERFWPKNARAADPASRPLTGLRILDIGCGKGYLLYEFTKLLEGVYISGLDKSSYAIKKSKEEISQYLSLGCATDLPYQDNYFDLVIDQVNKGGWIIADNVLWSGKVLEEPDVKDKETIILQKFNEKVHHDSRVRNVLFPVRDGMMLMIKN